jgi:hypothetical protein
VLHLAPPHLAALHLAALHLAALRLGPPRVRYLGGCEASARRARFGNYDRPADPRKRGSHVSSRADLGSPQPGVHPRAVPHGLLAALSAGSASRPAACMADCW